VHHLPSLRHVTAGVGGFADIVSAAPELVFIGSFTAGRRDITVSDATLQIREDGAHTKFVRRVSSPTFSGPRAIANGQKVTYITERAVLQLRPDGLTITEIAPGVDLERDVLARADFPLLVSDQLKTMDADLFVPGRFGLALTAVAPHARIAALSTRAASAEPTRKVL